jgi:predicted nuclease of predicted toxin-antitoxin system
VRFPADESCDVAVVRALRAAGHDVLAVAEVAPRSDDDTVLTLATRENRVLLTEDKDFGQLVYANKQPSSGVILTRFPANARGTLPKAVLNLIAEK